MLTIFIWFVPRSHEISASNLDDDSEPLPTATWHSPSSSAVCHWAVCWPPEPSFRTEIPPYDCSVFPSTIGCSFGDGDHYGLVAHSALWSFFVFIRATCRFWLVSIPWWPEGSGRPPPASSIFLRRFGIGASGSGWYGWSSGGWWVGSLASSLLICFISGC